MTRIFTAALLAASLGFTSISAAPAAASERDVARFVAGAIALAIIAKAVKNSRAANASTPTNTDNGYYSGYANRYDYDDHRGDDDRDDDSKHKHKKYKYKKQGSSFDLPAKCYFETRTREGRKGYFGSACLNRNMARANRLPFVCEDTVRGRDGRRFNGFESSCLRKFGYRVEARR